MFLVQSYLYLFPSFRLSPLSACIRRSMCDMIGMCLAFCQPYMFVVSTCRVTDDLLVCASQFQIAGWPGYITLEDLEKLAPGDDNCCNGRCSDFWHNQWDPLVMSWRVGAALWLFKSKYPSWTKNLLPPECDFDREKWYVEDPWPRQDPWR